jgi:xanthine dehydrogenase accessory factor
MIIAVVGSGGKTTLIKQLATQFRGEGKSVFVTTTTHMFIESDTLLTDDPATILRTLEKTGYVMAGIPDGIKIKALPKETFDTVCAGADVVLVEADGSKHMPLKFPNSTEPVIPDGVDRILVVWGPHGLNKPAREVCHRLDLVLECLKITEDTTITRAHVRQLLQAGYLIPLRGQYPNAEITVYPEMP